VHSAQEQAVRSKPSSVRLASMTVKESRFMVDLANVMKGKCGTEIADENGDDPTAITEW
jgi:hypothetical protein